MAIGASRWQVIRQLLTESVLAFVAGGLGLVARWPASGGSTRNCRNVGRPWWMVFTMDWRTFAFLFGICIITGVCLVSHRRSTSLRTNVNETLKEGGRSGSTGIRAPLGQRPHRGAARADARAPGGCGLHDAQLLRDGHTREIGIDTSRVPTMQLILPVRKYPTTSRTTFMEQAEERLSAAPDIEAVSLPRICRAQAAARGRSSSPDSRTWPRTSGRASRCSLSGLGKHRRHWRTGPARARLQRIRRLARTRGAIVSQRLVDMHFEGGNPLDGQIRFASYGTGPAGLCVADRRRRRARMCVNARTTSQPGRSDRLHPAPAGSTLTSGMTLIARTRAGAAGAGQTLREGMRAVDPDQALFNLRTLDEVMGQQRFIYRVFGTMFSVFAFIDVDTRGGRAVCGHGACRDAAHT